MKERTRQSIALAYGNKVGSLCWENDHLIDHANLMTRYFVDGEIGPALVSYGYRFDNAVCTSDGVYAALYEKFGTKAVLLRGGKIIREVERSFFYADVYEYPISIFIRDEKVYLAHCPKHYNAIEIEEFETGERITKDRPFTDFFQSRLQVSPQGRWLLSAGWIWHPLDAIELYDLSGDISKPRVLSPFWENSMDDIGLWEVHQAAFIDDSTLLMSGNGDVENEDANREKAIVVYDLDRMRIISRTVIEEVTGKLMPVNQDFAIAFYNHPKLIDIKTGNIVHRWADILTDEQNSSIRNPEYVAKIAIDQANGRFAVALPQSIKVVVLEA